MRKREAGIAAVVAGLVTAGAAWVLTADDGVEHGRTARGSVAGSTAPTTEVRPALAATSTQVEAQPAAAALPAAKPAADAEATPTPTAPTTTEVARTIARYDWARGVKAFVRASSGDRSPDTVRAAAKLQLFLADLQERLGLESREALLRHPLVQEMFLPAWVESLGVELAPAQRAGVQAFARKRAEALEESTDQVDPTTVGRIAQQLAQQRELEQALGGILEPDQRTRFARSQRLPLARKLPPQMRVRGSSPEQLAQRVAAVWRAHFKLSTSELEAAQAEARTLVRGMLAVPGIDGRGFDRRQAMLERLGALAKLQAGAEQRLAQRLDKRSQGRLNARGGSSYLLTLDLRS